MPNESSQSVSDLLKEAFAEINGAQVFVVSHLRPDGDCIGSQVAMVRLLRQLGFSATALNADPVPRNLQDLIADTPFVHELPADRSSKEVAIFVDCAGRDRIGKELAEQLPEPLLNIDHHISNNGFARFNFINPQAPSTASILTEAILNAGWDIDPVTANALYAGIATDTGQFRYPLTTAEAFDMASKLCSHGANPAQVANWIYEQDSFAHHKLLQRFLASLQLIADGRCCIGTIDDKDFDETGASTEDSEGLVEYARALDGVEIGVYLEERKGMIKGSLRSHDAKYRVDQVAALYSGGGHACAAGFKFKATLKEFLPEISSVLEDLLNKPTTK